MLIDDVPPARGRVHVCLSRSEDCAGWQFSYAALLMDDIAHTPSMRLLRIIRRTALRPRAEWVHEPCNGISRIARERHRSFEPPNISGVGRMRHQSTCGRSTSRSSSTASAASHFGGSIPKRCFSRTANRERGRIILGPDWYDAFRLDWRAFSPSTILIAKPCQLVWPVAKDRAYSALQPSQYAPGQPRHQR
jgi:hypothetical protein